MRYLKNINKIISLMILMLASMSANALDFHVLSDDGSILADGSIEINDAEKLEKIVTLEFKQKHHIVRDLVTINFNSKGGSLLGALRLGHSIRKIGVRSVIQSEHLCLSACAIAFLGGEQRLVIGKYGVHAARFRNEKNAETSTIQIDAIQYYSAITTTYIKEMTGIEDLAIKALSTRAVDMLYLEDQELSSLRVITAASRPSQFGRPSFQCPSKIETSIASIICSHIDISILDEELSRLNKILKSEAKLNLEEEYIKWTRYRDSCLNDGQPNGYRSIVFCIKESYESRKLQLMSYFLQYKFKTSRPGITNWSPIEK